MNIGSIFKMAKGAIGPDELAELLSSLGWEVEFRQLELGDRPPVLEQTARSAAAPGSKVMWITGTDQEGNQVDALMVVTPVQILEKTA